MSERLSTFGLFCLGAALFLAAYLTAIGSRPGFPLLLETMTALFGLPYVVRELWRRTNWLAVAYFLLFVPAFHRAAMEAAVRACRLVEGPPALAIIPSMPGPGAMVAAGLAGGMVGGLSLFLLALPRLRSPAPIWWRIALLGFAVLTLIGGLVIGLNWEYSLIAIYPLWQIPFGWFLACLIRPSPPRTAERPCREDGLRP
jgi:hypothetical protein